MQDKSCGWAINNKFFSVSCFFFQKKVNKQTKKEKMEDKKKKNGEKNFKNCDCV